MDDDSSLRDLRVSNAEREHVAELLNTHMVAGRLTPDEYAERLETATRATTRSELDSVLVDLPGAQLSEAPAKDVLELANTVGDLRRNGQWVVPSKVTARSWCGNVRLDCSEARFSAPVITVELSVGIGNVDLVLPAGATVDVDGAWTSVGSLIDKTTKTFERGSPHVVVRGGTKLGNIRIKTSGKRPRS